MLCKNCGRQEAEAGSDYCQPCEDRWLAAGMSRDEQEALSRAHSDDVIRLLPLRSGAIAVFNNARELCGIAEVGDAYVTIAFWKDIWFPPKKAPAIDLEELGLL